ncbi:MAG: HAMP domain-containing sensor histidine kinase, partial [Bacteroidota bacterium]
GLYHLSFLVGLVGFAQFGVLFLNHHQIFQVNWLTYQFVNSFFLFYFSTILGPQVPTYWFYVIILKTAFIYSFGRRHVWLKRGMNVFLVGSIIADVGFRVKPFGSVFIEARYLDFLMVFEPAVCFLLMVLFVYYFMTETRQTNRQMARQAKKLRAKNEELLRLNDELDKLVYHAWHDLRAPIASAMGLINLARDETDMEVVQQYLKLQDKSLRKLDKLIRDLLDYKRNRELAVQKQFIDFDTVVQEALAACKCEEQNCGADVEIIIDQKGEFFTDQQRLNMILKNLISNAIRYSKPDDLRPHIKVEVKTIGDKAHIVVEDEGIGIREDLHDRIFDMFYRASNQSDGTGLGLYVVNETLEKLGGTLALESTLGVGSQFEIIIPNMAPTDHLEQHRPAQTKPLPLPEFA